MCSRFREFINQYPFVVSIFKEEAAPAMGTDNAPPSNPDNKNNDQHFDAMKGQLGMEDDDFDAALSSGSITIWMPRDFSEKWGFVVSGVLQADVNKRPDGMYDVLFHLKDKKLMMPKAFILPYKQGQRPINYNGPVEDKTEVMTPEELQDAMAKPLEGGGMAAGGGDPMGGMGMPSAGGTPPMGGGMSGMGSPGGPMGAM